MRGVDQMGKGRRGSGWVPGVKNFPMRTLWVKIKNVLEMNKEKEKAMNNWGLFTMAV